MTQQDIYQARKFIKQKRYGEARDLLIQIDHPTASRWLEKLDEIDPPIKYKNDTPKVLFPWISLLLLLVIFGLFIKVIPHVSRLGTSLIFIIILICVAVIFNFYIKVSNYLENHRG